MVPRLNLPRPLQDENNLTAPLREHQRTREDDRGRMMTQTKGLSHQDGPEDRGADAVGHLELSLIVGSCEVVVPPGTKHPENKPKKRETETDESPAVSSTAH